MNTCTHNKKRRLESFQMHMTHWRGSEDGSVAGGVGQDEKEMFYKLLPIAFLFMAFVCGASTVCCVYAVPPDGEQRSGEQG